MGTIDIGKAERPTRLRVGGVDAKNAARFRSRFTPAAKRHLFIRDEILFPARETPVNPARQDIGDAAAAARQIKDLVLEMGADDVGIAAYDPRFVFTQVEPPPDHKAVIVYAIAMKYDAMADIGPRSQEEVHRVYHRLDDIGVRLAHQIGAYGYAARMQPNGGDLALPAVAQLAGLGELGKHGSLISPRLGSSFRLGAVSTTMPLAADGPKDDGIDEVCASCGVCTRFCPGEAIKPDKKVVNGVERWHVDTPACEPYFHRLYGCKICLMVCPLNSRGLFKDQFKLLSRDIVAAKDAKGMLDLIEARTDMHYEDFEDPEAESEPFAGPKD